MAGSLPARSATPQPAPSSGPWAALPAASAARTAPPPSRGHRHHAGCWRAQPRLVPRCGPRGSSLARGPRQGCAGAPSAPRAPQARLQRPGPGTLLSSSRRWLPTPHPRVPANYPVAEASPACPGPRPPRATHRPSAAPQRPPRPRGSTWDSGETCGRHQQSAGGPGRPFLRDAACLPAGPQCPAAALRAAVRSAPASPAALCRAPPRAPLAGQRGMAVAPLPECCTPRRQPSCEGGQRSTACLLATRHWQRCSRAQACRCRSGAQCEAPCRPAASCLKPQPGLEAAQPGAASAATSAAAAQLVVHQP
mmetsp:Transcript_67254/g.217051  ORF Transcript_67254/g.217051 Transcript_67254/m.217051 type:complete len:308 (-) Transcript_67254:880-1803(-)